MRLPWLVVLAGCGRLGFDHAGSDVTGDGAGGDTLTTANSNVVFLSNFLVVPGSIGGVAAADAKCTMNANAAGLDGPFVAFLSSTQSDFVARLGSARGWKRPDGLPIADRITDLAGGVRHMINIDERGTYVAGTPSIVTATNATAMLDASQGTCGDWTVPSTASVASGRSDVTSTEFANRGFFTTCDAAAHLFCFGTRSTTPLDTVRVQGRVAFVSETGWRPGGGRAAADAHCATEAAAASLPGTYLALLPTGTTTAASRFDLNGAPWVRVDGARLARSPMALMTQQLDTTLNLTAKGTVNDGYVWSGYGSKDATGLGESTCSDWQSVQSGTGGLGDSRYSSFLYDPGTGGNGGPCNGMYPLFCLQK